MTGKTAQNPLFGKFDAVAEALVQTPSPKPDKLEKGPPARQPASPPARQQEETTR